jgi:4'-phosphopantetheinyl transferase
MPIIFSYKIDSSTSLCVWHITETEESLFSNLILNNDDITNIIHLKLSKRRLEKLACRQCLAYLLGDNRIDIEYGKHGEPVIQNHYISFSHSDEFAAVAISNKYSVGIDIEKIGTKIIPLAYKFMNEQELLSSESDNSEYIHYFWGAKEAIYKIHKVGNIDYKENILVKKNQQKGFLHTSLSESEFNINSWIIENMMLVCVTEIPEK